MVKWSNTGKGVTPSPSPWCSSYWKGSLLVALDFTYLLVLYNRTKKPAFLLYLPNVLSMLTTRNNLSLYIIYNITDIDLKIALEMPFTLYWWHARRNRVAQATCKEQVGENITTRICRGFGILHNHKDFNPQSWKAEVSLKIHTVHPTVCASKPFLTLSHSHPYVDFEKWP